MLTNTPFASRDRCGKVVVVGTALLFVALSSVGCGDEAEGAMGLQQMLASGHAPDWYARQLERSGYEVTAINYAREDYAEYEVVRDTESYEVQLQIDTETGTVDKVTVEDNPWQVTATEEAVERNEGIIEIASGTQVTVKLNDYLDSGENEEGDTFSMTVAEAVVVGDEVAIPVGTRIRGHVASVESAQRPNKGGRLVLKADAMDVDGEQVEFEAVVTAPAGDEGDSSVEEDIKEIAGGAGLGGLVGGLIGGGKGVLAGVLIGAGGMFLATKGEQIELPPDTQLIVEFRESVRVPR
jgi:hypothetical protein